MAAVLLRALAGSCLLVLLVAACGGESGAGEPGGRKGLTDPAAVPTATPGDGKLVFRIGQDGISAPGSDVTVTPVAGPNTPGPATTYTVVAGDTCSAIAASYGIALGELLAVNPLVNAGCTNLRVDQELRIPAGSGAGNPDGGGGTANAYVIVGGDTCGSIAEAHGVTLATFLTANGLAEADCTTLSIGQLVTIPAQ